MNIKLRYMYRDGANYKLRAETVFANPDGWSAAEVFALFLEAAEKWQLFAETIHFRPEYVDLKTCYFTELGYAPNDDDILLHEVEQIEDTPDAPTDSRTIRSFLADVHSTVAYRWPS